MSWLNFVINISSCQLNNDHLSALEKGVWFAPTNREADMSLTLSELESYCSITCRNSTERENIKNALQHIGTRLDGTLTGRYSENLKWDRDHQYSPTSLESLVRTRGAATPTAEIRDGRRDGRRNSRPRHRRNNDRQTGDRRAVYPSYQPMDMSPSDKNFQELRRNSTPR